MTEGTAIRTHQQLDARSLALHRLIVDKIRRNPVLFERVGQTLERWRPITPTGTLPYLDEWQRLVEQGMDHCLEFATEDSQHAATLRQSSPFTGILTHQERFAFFKGWHRDREKTGP